MDINCPRCQEKIVVTNPVRRKRTVPLPKGKAGFDQLIKEALDIIALSEENKCKS